MYSWGAEETRTLGCVEESGDRAVWEGGGGGEMWMEQLSQNGTISRESSDHLFYMQGRRTPVALLEVLRSAPARTMETVTIIAIIAETPGESAKAARIHPALNRAISMQI